MKWAIRIVLPILLPLLSFADITGVVSTTRGNAVSGAFVRFVESADPTKEASAYTDSLGRYNIRLPGTVGTVTKSARPTNPYGALFQNYPNPVSAHTVISFRLDRAEKACLSIYSAQGRLVRTLFRGTTTGISAISWDRTDNAGRRVADGIYFYVLSYGGRELRKRMVVYGPGTCNKSGSSVKTPDESKPITRSKSALASNYNIYVYGRNIYPVKERSVVITDGMVRNFTQPYIDLWDSTRTILRDNLANCRNKFQKTGQGRVAFVGGSITYNPGWRTNIIDSIKKRFPQTVFDFINAGIPSVGSNMHAFRLQNDVFYRGSVDLLFVESAVNDISNNIVSKIRTRATEGIVRQALRNNPNVDIVFQYFIAPEFYTDVHAGNPIQCIVDYEKSGWYYGVSGINDAQYVAETMTWAQFGGNVHPGALGTTIYTNAIQRMLLTAWNDTSQAQIFAQFVPIMPLDTLSYRYGHFDTLSAAQLDNGWTYIPSWIPGGTAGTRPGFVNVPVLQATAAGAQLKFDFRGKVVGIVITTGPDVGKLDYSIDGVQLGTVDQFTPWSANLHLPWTFIFADTLTNATHRLVLRTATTRNSASTGYACRIHRFMVNGE